MSKPIRFLLACLLGSAAWIACEVTFGLAFLGLGVRLWHYDILPLLWRITSPVVWLLAFLLIAPITAAYDRVFRLREAGPLRRVALRLAGLMAVGPVIEVLLNRYLFTTFFGRPLYLYTVLPTFGGSGSLLSPLYYATLYVHMPVIDRLYASGARRSPSPVTRSSRAASISPAA